MIRKYIQNIISESLENIRAKEIELLKKILQTSYYKIHTGKYVANNKKKYRYAESVLKKVHNFTAADINSILEPTKYKLKEEERQANKRLRQQLEAEHERQHSQSGSIFSNEKHPTKPRRRAELPSTKDVLDHNADKQRQGYRWSDEYQDWIK